MVALCQNETPDLNRAIDEVEISPPTFTGIRNYIDISTIHPNYLQHYLATNVEYPNEAVKSNKEGVEIIKFKVNALGKVTDIDIVNGVCPAINDEIIRVLEATNGMWRPGTKDGIPVTMEQEVSVVFSLSEDPKEVGEKFLKIATSCFTKGAESFFVDGKSRKAERLFTQGIKYMPKDQSLLLMRGLVRYERGNFDGANDDWSRLVELGSIDMNASFLTAAKQLDSYKALMAMLEKIEK